MTGDEIQTRDYLITGPTIEPLDLEEVKKQRRFSATSLDTLFDLWIGAARQDFEQMTGIQLLTATREYALDAFPGACAIQIPRPPLQAIVSITYGDAGGSPEQTVDAASYVVTPPLTDPPSADVYPSRSRVALVAGASWPTVTGQPGLVRIRYRCGFGDAPGAVPELIVYALQLFVGSAHKYSEDLLEQTLERLPLGAQQVMRNAMWAAAQTLIPRLP